MIKRRQKRDLIMGINHKQQNVNLQWLNQEKEREEEKREDRGRDGAVRLPKSNEGISS